MVTIAQAFEIARQEDRLALIGYLPAGYPDPQTYRQIAQAAFGAGLDILEIGLPTVDPCLDGEVIRAALFDVMRRGINTRAALDLGGSTLEGSNGAGLAMFYPESLSEFGKYQMLDQVQALGISGILPVGMEIGAWQNLAVQAHQRKLAPIGFITPEMDEEKIFQVASRAGGFLYLQSQNGLTGQQGEFGEEVHERVSLVRSITREQKLPIAIGFGVRQAADVERISRLGVDGVILGTAFLEAAMQGYRAVEALVKELRLAARLG